MFRNQPGRLLWDAAKFSQACSKQLAGSLRRLEGPRANNKSGDHDIDHVRGAGGMPYIEKFEILHALKCVLGASEAPFCACSIGCSSYKFKFMKSQIQDDISVAAKFSNTCRYIDDLLTFNNCDFQPYIGQIYPRIRALKNYRGSQQLFLPGF